MWGTLGVEGAEKLVELTIVVTILLMSADNSFVNHLKPAVVLTDLATPMLLWAHFRMYIIL
jgi:hypothetical protein